LPIPKSIHPLPGESEREARFLALLDAFPARRVAVIGDLIADEFIYGRVARVSREAPVLILQYDSTQILAGGAGNAANNVATLGARAQIVGFAGQDEAGKRLQASLGHVDTRGLLSPDSSKCCRVIRRDRRVRPRLRGTNAPRRTTWTSPNNSSARCTGAWTTRSCSRA
jgi:hypothetical protein